MTLFSRKKIEVNIMIGLGQYGEEEGPTTTLSGLRVAAQIVSFRGEQMGHAVLRIYGLSLKQMGELTVVGPINNTLFGKNAVSIAAGNDGEALTTVYSGTIHKAQGHLQGSPDAYLEIYTAAGGVAMVKPVGDTTFKGDTPATTVIERLAKDANFQFVDKGVKAVMKSPYLSGSTLEKLREVSRSHDVRYSLSNNILKIWEDITTLSDEDYIYTSPQTGMVNYPIFSEAGIEFSNMFNPNFEIGKFVVVSGSEITQANGDWRISKVHHSLESETPGGEWFTNIAAFTG